MSGLTDPLKWFQETEPHLKVALWRHGVVVNILFVQPGLRFYIQLQKRRDNINIVGIVEQSFNPGRQSSSLYKWYIYIIYLLRV